MRNLRCLVLGHTWKKKRVEDSAYLQCVRCAKESQPGNFGGTLGAGF